MVIEAIQYNGTNGIDIARWSNGKAHEPLDGSIADGNIFIHINTLGGTMRGDIGDFIIKGIKEEFYPCKPDIFEATYEKVDD